MNGAPKTKGELIPATGGDSRRVSSEVAEAFRQTRRDHATEVAEDYVELIDDLIRACGEARPVDIAKRLGVSHVTVNQTVGRLQRLGLVRKEPYRSVFLTERGSQLAAACRRRHRIVLEFLCAIGVPEEQAGIDAEGVEHHISSTTLQAMAEFLASRPIDKVPNRAVGRAGETDVE